MWNGAGSGGGSRYMCLTFVSVPCRNDGPRLRCAVITPKCEGLLVIIMIEWRNIIRQGHSLALDR